MRNHVSPVSTTHPILPPRSARPALLPPSGTDPHDASTAEWVLRSIEFDLGESEDLKTIVECGSSVMLGAHALGVIAHTIAPERLRTLLVVVVEFFATQLVRSNRAHDWPGPSPEDELLATLRAWAPSGSDALKGACYSLMEHMTRKKDTDGAGAVVVNLFSLLSSIERRLDVELIELDARRTLRGLAALRHLRQGVPGFRSRRHFAEELAAGLLEVAEAALEGEIGERAEGPESGGLGIVRGRVGEVTQ